MIATQRLYRTEDDRIVPEGDPDARWLFAAAGTEISAADAAKYGLGTTEPASAAEEPPAEPDAEPEAPEEPAAEADPESESAAEALEEPPKPKRKRRPSN